MNYKQKIFFFLAIVLGTIGISNAQNACLEEVRSIYRKMAAMGQGETGKAFYMKYKVRTVTLDSAEDGINSSTVEVCMKGSSVHLKAKEMEIYKNETTVFSVLPLKKIVVRADPDDRISKKRKDKLGLLQDTLFSMCKVTCIAPRPGTTMRSVLMEVNAMGMQKYHIKKMLLYISDKEEIKKIRVDYTDQSYGSGFKDPILYAEYTFEQVNFDYKGATNLDNIEGKFIAKDGKLVKAFDGYEFVDSRAKENKQTIR